MSSVLVDQVGAVCVVLSWLEEEVGQGEGFFSWYTVSERLEK